MIKQTQLNDEFKYQSIPEWDSVGHMGLIAGLEEAFEIMLEMDDIIEFSSYKQGVDILAKYEIEI
jgi:acyl carrier protein